MSESVKKYLSIASWLVIASLAAFDIYDTVAYFNDLETSANNKLGMSELDFSLNSPQPDFVSLEKTLGLFPGFSLKRDIYLKQEGKLPFKYKARIDPLKCDPNLLSRLHLEVWYNYFDDEALATASHLDYLQEKKYDGTLGNFQDFDTNIPNHDPDLQMSNHHNYFKNIFYSESEHWFRFKISLDRNALDDLPLISASCNFDIVFEGWQENYDQADQVFSDTERINNTIYLHGYRDDLDTSTSSDEVKPIDLFDYSCGDNCPDILLPEVEVVSDIEVTLPVAETSEVPVVEEIVSDPILDTAPVIEPEIAPAVELPAINNPE